MALDIKNVSNSTYWGWIKVPWVNWVSLVTKFESENESIGIPRCSRYSPKFYTGGTPVQHNVSNSVADDLAVVAVSKHPEDIELHRSETFTLSNHNYKQSN